MRIPDPPPTPPCGVRPRGQVAEGAVRGSGILARELAEATARRVLQPRALRQEGSGLHVERAARGKEGSLQNALFGIDG